MLCLVFTFLQLDYNSKSINLSLQLFHTSTRRIQKQTHLSGFLVVKIATARQFGNSLVQILDSVFQCQYGLQE